MKYAKWIVWFVLTVTLPLRAEEPHRILVIPPGIFHGDEVSFVKSKEWFALVAGEDSSRLVPVSLRLEPLDVPQDSPKELIRASRHRVSSVPDVSAIVYLIGPNVGAGDVPAAKIDGPQRGLRPKTFSLGGNTYSLALSADCDKSKRLCQWNLSDGDTVQTIHKISVIYLEDVKGFEGGYPYSDSDKTGVLWAGDLDYDGKLDLIVDVSNHYNSVADIRVFLSSAAAEGELLGEVAWFSSVGG